MQTARKVAIWTAVAGSAFAAFSSTPAHADTYVGTLSNKPAYEQPTFTIAVGPMIGVPIGDHAFENKSGAGLAGRSKLASYGVTCTDQQWIEGTLVCTLRRWPILDGV